MQHQNLLIEMLPLAQADENMISVYRVGQLIHVMWSLVELLVFSGHFILVM